MDEPIKKKKVYSSQEASRKAESYCAYQERSQQEVRDKLYDWGLHYADVESIISYLIEENFLNEERFATAYVLGKFRMKAWGKIKIKSGLKQKQVSSPLIKFALDRIDPNEYMNKLIDVLEKKNRIIREEDPFKKRNKLFQYGIGRGFESQLILEVLKDNEFGF
ncbi:MAG: regulatory protein RecX [Sphingobacterium sp.]